MGRTTDRSDLVAVVRRIVLQELDHVEDGELTNTLDLPDEADADSLSVIQILVRVERELGVRIPPEQMGGARTVEAIVTLVESNPRSD